MFTGIIESTAEVLEKTDLGITVGRPPTFDDVRLGSSVAVSGVCLTVVHLTENAMRFDVVAETWSRTTLGEKKPGDYVNLERALAATGRFEGHVVQGHVEGVAEVISSIPQPLPPEEGSGVQEDAVLTLHLPPTLSRFITPKGSIALDGVSLTVADVGENDVTVALIPFTRSHTTLGALAKGDRVNVETDIFARYLEKFLSHRSHA